MSTFTIDAENNISAFPNATDATECDPDIPQFDSEAALAKLSADWPMSRFVEIWNSIPGNAEVSKLGDRKRRRWRESGKRSSHWPAANPKRPAKRAKTA